MGYMQDYPVERMLSDVKLTQILSGTYQIQHLVIAREILKGPPDRRRSVSIQGESTFRHNL